VNSKELEQQLENPDPYLYSEVAKVKIPDKNIVPCRIINKDNIKLYNQMVHDLKRPYHPLLYTSMSNIRYYFVCLNYNYFK
jgi:hypothetical protein